MFSFIGKSCLMLTLLSSLVSSNKHAGDYDWKEFDGEVPHHALLAGIDNKGPVYIGQVLYKGEFIVGKLYRNDEHIYFEYGGHAKQAKENIKILCTTHPEKFVWLSTKNGEYGKVSNAFLLTGGHEQGFRIHIGRVFIDNETILGKVVCRETFCLGLYASHNNKAEEHYSYDILTYDPNIKLAIKKMP